MPQLYNAAVITDAGIALLNRAQAGEAQIQFTRMAAGDGVYTEEEKTLSALQGSTGLKSERGSYPISSVGAASDNSVKLTAIITNQDPVTGETLVSDGYYINEMGLYAKEKEGDDNTEVLYSIVTVASGNGDYMPPYNGHSPAQIVQEYHATVSNAAEVTIRCTGAALLVEDAERLMEEMRNEITPLPKGLESGYVRTGACTHHYESHVDRVDLTPGEHATAEGHNTIAKGENSHAEGNGGAGYTLYADGELRYDSGAHGKNSHVEGMATLATGNNCHSEGYNTKAATAGSHSEGIRSRVSCPVDDPSGLDPADFIPYGAGHAEGYETESKGQAAHAEGIKTRAYGVASHSEGQETRAGQTGSHSEGRETVASGAGAHAQGYKTEAAVANSLACGRINKPMGYTGGSIAAFDDNAMTADAFVLGNGIKTWDSGTSSYDFAPSNAVRMTFAGEVYGLSNFGSSGADYAEFIKAWADGNPDGEDRVGYLVTIKDGLLHKAEAGDYIVGITSGNPSIVGNNDEDYYWRYERDEFNRFVFVTEYVPEVVPVLDDGGIQAVDGDGRPMYMETGEMIRYEKIKVRDDYDQSLQDTYVERKHRPEWDYVGMMGVLPVRDDGTCVPGSFCKCADGGIATLATERGFDTYMVIERITDSVVSVILR